MTAKNTNIQAPTTALTSGLPSAKVAIALACALALLPLVFKQFDADFYIVMCTRILILGLAASALNLALGYGGMVSLGHAAFFGVGGYTAALLSSQGLSSMSFGIAAAVAVSGLLAWAIGAISLRTKGVYFIMITLAFAQLVYLVALSFSFFGGDDGIMMMSRSTLAAVDLENDLIYYYFVFAWCVLIYFLLFRLIHSRFGRALVAIRENENRAAALGYPVFSIKVLAFVISGMVAGLAGALLANLGHGITPHALNWHQSGLLMVMVILGGVGNFWGGLIGAGVFMFLEELISERTEHWNLYLGFMLLIIVMFVPNGVMTLKQRLLALMKKGFKP